MENFIFLCSLKGIRNFDTGICDPSERLSILTLHETKDVVKKVFNNGPSKIFGRRSLKNLKCYDLLKQTISHQIF